MEISEISLQEFEQIKNTRPKSRWQEVIEQVKQERKALKISGLSKGSLAAGYRAAKNAGIRAKTDYKNGTLYLAPSQ